MRPIRVRPKEISWDLKSGQIELKQDTNQSGYTKHLKKRKITLHIGVPAGTSGLVYQLQNIRKETYERVRHEPVHAAQKTKNRNLFNLFLGILNVFCLKCGRKRFTAGETRSARETLFNTANRLMARF